MTTLHPEPRLGRLAPHGIPPLPMAVGVLALPPTTDDHRNAARLDLALSAYKLGYFVVDTIEVTPATGKPRLPLDRCCGRTDRRRRPRLRRRRRPLPGGSDRGPGPSGHPNRPPGCGPRPPGQLTGVPEAQTRPNASG